KVPDKALAILKQYPKENRQHNLIFPELEVVADISDTFMVQRRISFSVKNLNDALVKVAEAAGITKKLTMHIARHTFGNLSGDKIPLQMLQKLYRHSSVITTMGYQANFIHKDTDDALDSVVDF
ncbi:MAG TPA: tyrosine-type recombinase/integrase, partial [Daejeonella sp.]